MLKHYYKIIELFETVLNILMVLILNVRYLFHKTRYPKIKNDSIQVLGNGPSLKDDIPEILKKRENSPLMVVNTFATTDLFEKLKPEYYIMIDPAFFSPPKNERIKKVQETTTDALIEKTRWKLHLFIPISGRKSSLVKSIKNRNKNIKIIEFKNIPVIGGSDLLNTFLFKNNLANPLYKNVLNTSIFLAIKMKFSKILIWGGDHSWIKDLSVNNQNEVFYGDRHVYNPKLTFIKEDKPFHSVLLSFALMFKSHHQISRYAKKIGVSLLNYSSDSFIDSYQKSNKK